MATQPERSAELLRLLDELSQDPLNFPVWADAEDLSRLHMQSFAQAVAGGLDLLASRGQIRLAGQGVHGHSVELTNVGELLSRWQNLVTSAGAAIEGNKSIGKLPFDLQRRTKLMLTAAPIQGSVVLEFAPEVDETQERYPGGQLPLGDQHAGSLVQKSVNVALDVLDLASSESADVAVRFADWGPRVASKALELAELAAGAQLDLEFTWEETGKGRRRSGATSHQLAQFATWLQAESLDTEPHELLGILRTVSDRKKIDLEIEDVESPTHRRVVAIDRGDVDFRDFRVGETVLVATTVKLTSKPGGQEGRSYRAESVGRTSRTLPN